MQMDGSDNCPSVTVATEQLERNGLGEELGETKNEVYSSLPGYQELFQEILMHFLTMTSF
jgi:hypothetical protein